MDFHVLVADNTIEKLKCSVCQNFLSCFPVYISTDNRNICGRCAVPDDENYIRNEAYESISQHIPFPCRYENDGCSERVPAKDMFRHEKCCPYRAVKCATIEISRCDWKGPHLQLLQHCHDEHSDIILKDGKFKIQFSESADVENLLELGGVFLMVIRNFDSTNSMLRFSVYQLENEIRNIDFKVCEVKFRCGVRNLSIDSYLPSFDERDVTEICLGVLKDPYDDDDVIYGEISLDETTEKNESLAFEKVNQELLSQLQCTLCGEYMMPPLELYQENQTRCAECRANEQKNSLYNNPIKNFNIDKVASMLDYPCKYKKNGCSFVSHPMEMKDHQKNCPYGVHTCPLSEYIKCEWNGLGKDVVSHVRKDHRDVIINTTEISELILKPQTNNSLYSSLIPSNSEFIKCYIIKFSNDLFRLTFSQKDQGYWWAMHKIGTDQCRNRFKYEIEVIDRNKKGRKLLMRQLCPLILTKKDKMFVSAEECCYFQNEQIEGLLNQNILTFKVYIMK